MKNLVRLLAVIALIIGSFWGKVPAQALNLTSIALPSLPVAVLNAADAKLTTEFGAKIDLEALEKMPLEELESLVNNLQTDLDRLELFVNDQEEELTLQSQTVEELAARMARIDEQSQKILIEILIKLSEKLSFFS